MVPITMSGMDACGSAAPVVIDDSDAGYILSPNYPNNYDVDLDCSWLIQAGANEKIIRKNRDPRKPAKIFSPT